MRYSALIVAAGKGITKGQSYNKMFKVLKKYHMTVLEKSTQLFLNDPRCAQVIIVTNPKDMKSVVLGHTHEKIVHVNGGPTRQESVFLGLMATKEDVVLIHDGARPWVDLDSIDRLLETMETEKAATLAVKVADTIKMVSDDYVERTIDRNNLVITQTPQAFETNLIINSYLKIFEQQLEVMEDTQAVELTSNTRIKIVPGSSMNNRIISVIEETSDQ